MSDHSGLSRRNDSSGDSQNSRLSPELPTNTREASGLSAQSEQGSTQADGQGPAPKLATEEIFQIRRGAQTKWTPEQDAVLKHMRADKCSFRTIANLLGVSRSACIGRAYRLALPIADRQIKIKIPKRNREGNVTVSIARRITARKSKVSKPPQPLKEVSVSSNFLGVGFFDLEPDMCRFPKGDGLAAIYCGQPVEEGTSYCPHCYRVTHVTRPNITDETRDRRAANIRRVTRPAFQILRMGDE